MSSIDFNIRSIKKWIARLEYYDQIRNSKYDAVKWRATIDEAKKQLKIHEDKKRRAP